MSETKEPYKWYTAYTSSFTDGITFVFNTLEEARDHAIANGEFEDICGKDAMIDHEQNLFFEITEYELQDYHPVQLMFKIIGEAV